MHIRPSRRVQTFAAALIACLTVSMLAASSAGAQSAGAQPARPMAAASHAAAQAAGTVDTLCLHSSPECLNDTQCKFQSVQLWNINTGASCALTATFVGTVNPAGWPFFCHRGLNVQFAGLPVFFVGADDDTNADVRYRVQSAGYGNTVTLTPVGAPDPGSEANYIGYWVAASENSNGTVLNSQMIDAFETCNTINSSAPYYQSAVCRVRRQWMPRAQDSCQ